MSQAGDGASPHAADAAVNRATPAKKHLPLAEQVPKAPAGDQQHGEHQRVGVDDPEHVIERGVQLVDHVGDRAMLTIVRSSSVMKRRSGRPTD
jgi:hypothetical protein